MHKLGLGVVTIGNPNPKYKLPMAINWVQGCNYR